MLDSNAVIALLKSNASLIQQMRRHDPEDFAISSVVAYELYYGAFKSQRVSENIGYLHELKLRILDFDADDARSAGLVRASLEKVGKPIGPYDILIAGQTLAKGLTLITRNTREFSRVEGLAIENWQD